MEKRQRKRKHMDLLCYGKLEEKVNTEDYSFEKLTLIMKKQRRRRGRAYFPMDLNIESEKQNCLDIYLAVQ